MFEEEYFNKFIRCITDNRIDNTMLIFVYMVETKGTKEKGVIKLKEECEKLLADTEFNSLVDLYYKIDESQEESKTLYNPKYEDSEIYDLASYPYNKIKELKLRITKAIALLAKEGGDLNF